MGGRLSTPSLKTQIHSNMKKDLVKSLALLGVFIAHRPKFVCAVLLVLGYCAQLIPVSAVSKSLINAIGGFLPGVGSLMSSLLSSGDSYGTRIVLLVMVQVIVFSTAYRFKFPRCAAVNAVMK